jgi:osmotically-inducible protein OsmY
MYASAQRISGQKEIMANGTVRMIRMESLSMKQLNQSVYDAVLLKNVMDGRSKSKSNDALITSEVRTAMANAPSLQLGDINVETLAGRVRLSGFVGSMNDRANAVGIARGINGVKSVQNDVTIR